tara:strand:+ start:949 stop:1524 length:576 start_codon:yes stop_codon:yes gene_type:complete
MPKLVFERTTKVKTTLAIAWSNVGDHTHFKWAHHKHFSDFLVLYEHGIFQAVYYSSKIIYPLPFKKRYVAIRELNGEKFTLRQIYQDIGSGKRTYLRAHLEQHGEDVHIINRMVFDTSPVTAIFAPFIAKLWNRRLHAMWLEDREILEVRSQNGWYTNDACLPLDDSLYQEFGEKFDSLLSKNSQYSFTTR